MLIVLLETGRVVFLKNTLCLKRTKQTVNKRRKEMRKQNQAVRKN